jgi:hypothetical protein
LWFSWKRGDADKQVRCKREKEEDNDEKIQIQHVRDERREREN